MDVWEAMAHNNGMVAIDKRLTLDRWYRRAVVCMNGSDLLSYFAYRFAKGELMERFFWKESLLVGILTFLW